MFRQFTVSVMSEFLGVSVAALIYRRKRIIDKLVAVAERAVPMMMAFDQCTDRLLEVLSDEDFNFLKWMVVRMTKSFFEVPPFSYSPQKVVSKFQRIRINILATDPKLSPLHNAINLYHKYNAMGREFYEVKSLRTFRALLGHMGISGDGIFVAPPYYPHFIDEPNLPILEGDMQSEVSSLYS